MSTPAILWIGLVEMKPLDAKAYGAAGAFTNIVTWAGDAHEFRKKAETIAATLGMFVFDIQGAEPTALRFERRNRTEEVEDMISRAISNPNAIVYGTFHRYPYNEA